MVVRQVEIQDRNNIECVLSYVPMRKAYFYGLRVNGLVVEIKNFGISLEEAIVDFEAEVILAKYDFIY